MLVRRLCSRPVAAVADPFAIHNPSDGDQRGMWGSLAWAILLWRQASAQSDALAIVRTPADLKTALADGTAHVEIQQHLDLRGESLSAQATARFNIPPLYQPLGTFESLRVRPCTTAVHSGPEMPGLAR